MRDHTKLTAFQLADSLVLEVYRATAGFPTAERFGLTSQLRRAAISIPSNIVEGCARNSETEYVRYLTVAYASARELWYQLSLARRLGYMKTEEALAIEAQSEEVCRVLNGLIRAFQ